MHILQFFSDAIRRYYLLSPTFLIIWFGYQLAEYVIYTHVLNCGANSVRSPLN